MTHIASLAVQKKNLIERQLEVSVNNLANINTSGFQADRIVEKSQSYGYGSFGDRISFPQEVRQSLDTRPGNLQETAGDFDFALRQPRQYFGVEDINGNKYYTRNGEFKINPEGMLVAVASGHFVMDNNGTPIQIPEGTESFKVSRTGEVVIDGALATNLGIFEIAQADLPKLTKIGQNLYRPDGEEIVPFAPAMREVYQGFVEKANVQPTLEIAQLIRLQNENSQIQKVLETEHRTNEQTTERLLIPA